MLTYIILHTIFSSVKISVLENLEESGLSQKKDIKISSGITNVDAWDSYLAVGSTVSQIFSKEKETLSRRMIIAPEDESLKVESLLIL